MVRVTFPSALEDMMECSAVQTFAGRIQDSETQSAVRLAHQKASGDTLATALEFVVARATSHIHDSPREVN